MYEKGNPLKITVDIGASGITKLEFIGKVVLDANDFLAVQFDTLIIPKMDLKTVEPLPDKPLEEIFGTDREGGEAVERPQPPKVDNVRFLPEKAEKAEAPKK